MHSKISVEFVVKRNGVEVMVKKVFEADVPEDLHMGKSHDSEGSVGLLYDDDGNLRDHAVFRDVTDEYESNDYDYSTESVSYEALDEETAEALAAIIAALMIAAPIIYEKASPYIKSFFGDVVAPKFASVKDRIGNGIDTIIGRIKRKPESGEIVEVKPIIVDFGDADSVICLPEPEQQPISLTEEEAQRALIECFVAYSTLHDKLDLLRHAQIKSNNASSGYIEGSELISCIESPEGVKMLNNALEHNQDLLVQYSSLFSETLGHEILVDGRFRPIENQWLIDNPPDDDDGQILRS